MSNSSATSKHKLTGVFNEKAPPDYAKISSLYPQRKQDESYRYRPAGLGGTLQPVAIPISLPSHLPLLTTTAAARAVPASNHSNSNDNSTTLMTLSLYDGVNSCGELVSGYLEAKPAPSLRPSPTTQSTVLYPRVTERASTSSPRTQEPEVEPVCFRCNRCLPAGVALQLTALNAHFHPYCFVCYQCQTSLTQTSAFYHAAGRLLCEGCVSESLELCHVCHQPVTERILRALGRPHHPTCFRCAACRRQLDGQGFTVDIHDRILCLEDFHRAYAPRCAICQQAITPARGQSETRRVLVDNRSYHLACFQSSNNTS